MIAAVAAETGIDPRLLYEDDDLLEDVVEYLAERAERLEGN